MRKLVPGVLAVVLATVGLSPLAGPTASAAPYPGTVRTLATVASLGPVGPDERPQLRVELATRGNAVPRGPLEISMVRRDGVVRRLYERTYQGEPVVLDFPPLVRAGQYVVTVTFHPRTTSVYVPSADATRQVVEQS